jgi:transposase-like protein
MLKSDRPYQPEFRQRVELFRKGRTSEELSRQFEYSAQAIRSLVRQADRDEGLSPHGLSTDEQAELRRLRRENRTLREEREIFRKAAAWLREGDHLDPVQRFEFVTADRALHHVATTCRVLGVSPSGSLRPRLPVHFARLWTAVPRGVFQPSLGSVGDAYDNALCERFFATLEADLLARQRLATPAHTPHVVFDHIEGWYNPRRRHSALRYLPLIIYETRALSLL